MTKQPEGITISFTLAPDLKSRLDAFIPRQRKGKRVTPDFYRTIFERYLASPEFRLAEVTERVRRLEAEVKILKAQKQP